MTRIRFNKPPLSLSEQVNLLRSRGMLVRDQNAAEETLLRLNYYRFSGYALHFEEFEDRHRTHRFRPGTSLEQVEEFYEFDTRLRALLFRYIEPVEVAFRAALCHELSMASNDGHWYLRRAAFDGGFDFDRFIDECHREYKRSDEVFVQSYRSKYSDPPLPPAWMMSEILSIGRWSIMFKHLVDREARKAVARHFATKPYYLESWVHALSVLRNLCAHHCRIWNRQFKIRPRLPQRLKPMVAGNDRLAAMMLILAHLLRPLAKSQGFNADWEALLAGFPNVPRGSMGFHPDATRES